MIKVFVNGTFDIIHPGHLDLLYRAKSLGDYLLVALDSDRRVKNLKGEDRPINSLDVRSRIMSSFKPVDEVTSFDSDSELINIIKNYSPDVMMVGSDYQDKRVVGREYAKRVFFFDRDDRYSSTSVIEKIRYENSLCTTDL